MLSPQAFHVALVIVGRYKLVLAARKKCDEVAQKLGRLRQAPEMNQRKLRDIPAKKNPVVDVVQGLNVRVRRAENLFQAEGMEGAQPHAFGPLADGLDDAMLHLAGGFVGEGKAENILASETWIGLETWRQRRLRRQRR
jgi:hypothetical protein